MGPNDIIFFPAKLELKSDLMVEISTGNTSEISTELPSKSAILGRNFQISTLKLLPAEIFTGPKNEIFWKLSTSASFCTFNQVNSTKTRTSRSRQSWWILTKMTQILDFGIFGVWHQKSQNPPTLTRTRFSSFGAIDLIESTKWCWGAQFSKFLILYP